jgi:pimeloyl-ACP methyl ester carboxylesterase
MAFGPTDRALSKVIPALQADGHQVLAVQYGLNSYADDVVTVKRTLGRVNSPAILVGHSYGVPDRAAD